MSSVHYSNSTAVLTSYLTFLKLASPTSLECYRKNLKFKLFSYHVIKNKSSVMANFFGGSPWTQPVPDNIPVAARASTEVSLKLKLLVDRNANRVLFAEANKDFVDFLFWIFSLPMGTVVKFLPKDRGCLGKLYESIERLNETYMLPNQSKDSVLNPKVQRGRGFVKAGTYMVMDDLAVSPMSTISSITLLNKFSVKDVGALEERVVEFGINEGLKILGESMQSTTVLTSVFLGKKGVDIPFEVSVSPNIFKG